MENACVAVDVVVLTLRHGQLSVLLEQRRSDPWPGAWALPGRAIEAGESLEQAAYAELARAGLAAPDVVLEQLRTYGDPTRDPRRRTVSVAWMALGADLEVGDSDDVMVDWWPVSVAGRENLAFDHGTILADGVERARAKLEYSALATAFCQPEFTIPQLREVYEAVWGERLDPRNFHRKVMSVTGFVRDTGRRTGGRGRPATLYRHGGAQVLHPPILRKR